ncbi:hypothetical protein EJ04DRAFT_603497 [Polyplosphaeria fusca]|uniref:HD/PDEase domain-containing protein n=1 Tax=Polyplosphaeria fusca TaxID=682080 RepID=A0A9P4R0A7_9PLEO|nr:hypothetical protein EJ04DRAFT_603497 [Polyplosphaeria fusca]
METFLSTDPSLPGPYRNCSSLPSTILIRRFTNLDLDNNELANKVMTMCQMDMSANDLSHNWEHIQHVVANADMILEAELKKNPDWAKNLDPLTILLGCVIHDYADHKYYPHLDQDGCENIVRQMLLHCGADPAYANKLVTIASHVSFSHQEKNEEKVAAALKSIPELAVVMDADRLECIGSRGLGRIFAYHGAMEEMRMQSMQRCMHYFWQKLWKLPAKMNTITGRKVADQEWAWMEEVMEKWIGETARLKRVL